MFRKLLIANRGEVAVRIARACRKQGIRAVGVASQADLGSAWVAGMDEVVCVGPAASRESYLRREALVQAALQTSCSAIHPGWGFLAEDPLFAALCAEHRVTFVGPPPQVMERMAIKSKAKEAMREAGLPVIPGSRGVLRDVEEACALAREIGYPAMLKADAGGGGKGMRLCRSEAELREGYPAASAEATAAFGNGALYLERYLEGGRHIEVQVLADAFGNAVHLFERECSIQRHHQKLIEEAPSPAVDSAQRAELCEKAAAAAAAIGYVGAGTIEFLRDERGRFFFMEMNTRLQVEHTITEEVTGIDIVSAQLGIAANRSLASLGIEQTSIELKGHAIECRINAEDPSQGFRPTPGRLESFDFPLDAGPGRMRLDTHLAAGESVSSHYDSLLAKLIAHAPTREKAIETMRRSLESARVEGIATTIPLHLAVLESDAFRAARYDTRSIPGFPIQRVRA